MTDLSPDLPGYDLFSSGLEDLRVGRESSSSLLVSMAAPRLRTLGIELPEDRIFDNASHRLYDYLSDATAKDAHSRYNALVGRMTSFARAAEHASTR